MWRLYVTVGVTSIILNIVFCGALWTIYAWRQLYFRYPMEVFNMVFNAISAILGIGMYGLLLPVVGWPIISIEDAVRQRAEACHHHSPAVCQEYVDFLYALTWLSIVRFILWYGEFLNTFVYIARLHKVSKCEKRCWVANQYCMHSLNLALSISCVIVVAQPNFPYFLLPESELVSPFLFYYLVIVVVVFGFYTILHSPIYSFEKNFLLV